MEQLSTFLNPERMEQLTTKGIAMGANVLVALLIFIVGLWIANRVRGAIITLSHKSPHLDDTIFKFFASIAKYVILAFVFLAVLGRFGVQTTSIVAILGAASLAVGLALQGTMSNMAAGVMLMIFRPYKVGNFVDVGGKFGNVEEVTLFTTVLETFDSQQIIIPNSKIWGEQIVNHSHHAVRGVDMTFNIAYGDDIDKARKVIKKVLAEHPHIKVEPAPFIEVETLSERSVELLVRPFCDGAHFFEVRYSVPEQILKALGKAGMNTPYPVQKLVMVKD